MRVDGQTYRTVWSDNSRRLVHIIDQRHLPWDFCIENLASVESTATAIRDMHVRGAGCIGVLAAYGMWLAAHEAQGSIELLRTLANALVKTRPTARNLAWAVERQLATISSVSPQDWESASLASAESIADEDALWCEQIGQHGLPLLSAIHAEKSTEEPVQILTHCNAGWLAFSDWGSATAPIYAAHRAGIPVHVWVDETRPRNQGARLTAWELQNEGVPHTIIADNAGGHLMQHEMVDIVITGTDRTTGKGDVANKIGTYHKALAASDNGIPFYVTLPSSTFDWSCEDSLREIPIEERDGSEIAYVEGRTREGALEEVQIVNPNSPILNPAFDVTPARLITGLITERGVCNADQKSINILFPEDSRV
ncbi:MAG: S-methyl-5-thioribose-1-phosphate isomerase [Roseibacillus sp.]|nr:S-methyl-5-thioribose-1-phosphate isomerase [Roseibacillus sp.]